MTYGAPIGRDELREKLKEILNWTAFRAKETPVSIDKAINRIGELLDLYVAQEVRKGRTEELGLLEQVIEANEFKERFVTILKQHRLSRLADLEGTKEEETK